MPTDPTLAIPSVQVSPIRNPCAIPFSTAASIAHGFFFECITQHEETIAHDIGAQKANRRQSLVDTGRTPIAEQLEMFAQERQSTALGLDLRLYLHQMESMEKQSVSSALRYFAYAKIPGGSERSKCTRRVATTVPR